MLHYYAKNFFAPVIASAYEEDGKLKLYVVSDLLQVNSLFCLAISPMHSAALCVPCYPAVTYRVVPFRTEFRTVPFSTLAYRFIAYRDVTYRIVTYHFVLHRSISGDSV